MYVCVVASISAPIGPLAGTRTEGQQTRLTIQTHFLELIYLVTRLVPPLPAERLDAVAKGVVGHHHLAVEARVGHGAGAMVSQPGLYSAALVRVAVFADHRVDHHLRRTRRIEKEGKESRDGSTTT